MMGRWIDDETDAAARVGDMGIIDAVTMTPGAIANELARINTQMRSFHNELFAAAKARGLNDPTIAMAGWLGDVGDFLKGLIGGPPMQTLQAAQNAAAIAKANAAANAGSGGDDPVKVVLDAAGIRKLPNDPVVHLFMDGWMPLWNTWRTFFAGEREGSWWHNAAYDAEKYQTQLAQIRTQAEALGVKFVSPAPAPEHAGSSWFTLAKYGLIGAGILGGVYVVSRFRKGD